MTSPATHRPRHARAGTPAPAAPIDMPTQRIAAVVPTPPPGPLPHGTWPQGPVPFPPGAFGGVPIPPAGLPVGHPPIRRDRTMAVMVAVLLAFAVVALIVLASLIDGAVGSGNDGTGSTGGGASSSSSTSTAEDIGAWADGGGMSRTKAISDDLDAIVDAARIYDTSALNSACRSLRSDVESAQAYGPVPDARAQASWSSALTHGADAATYCIAGTDSMDSDLIGRSASELDEMTDDLGDVATRMDAITGS